MPPIAEQYLIPALVFLAVVAIGGAFIASAAAKRRALRPRLHDLANAAVSVASAGVGAGGQRLGLLNRLGALVSFGKTSAHLERELTRAGFHAKSAADVYLGLKILMLGLGALGAGAAVVPMAIPMPFKVMAAVFAGGLLSFAPNLGVALYRRRRTAEVRRFLPDATDLLEICVSSGMGLDMAWNSVTDEIRRVSTVLADEMALTNLEIQLGAPRPVAMRHLAERTGADELTSLVALLLQTERFGTSIGDALNMFAGSMREERSQKAEESAERMTVKLLFPMVLFIFPAVLIIMVGPAAVKIVDFMGRG